MIDLDVFLNGRLVGHLHSDDNDRFTFAYDQTYLGRRDAIPLSCSLPLQAEGFSYAQARPFFAGILPEERSREIVADRLHIARSNDIKLVNAIGGDCAGAVTLVPSGHTPEAPESGVTWLGGAAFAEVLRRLSARSLLAPGDSVRLSLAGAMSKLTVCHKDGKFGIPNGSTPSTHIIKPGMDGPGSEGLEDLVHNECFCAKLAETAGLAVARTSILAHEVGNFLLVERYDRNDEGQRIHQEDFCQALACVPGDKYQAQGGPSLADCYALLRAQASTPALAVNAFTRAVLFNLLIGNNDAHAKNFSLLHHADGHITLAPLYDLVCTEIYPRFRNSDMAMKFGGTYDFKWVNREHVATFARQAQLSPAGVRRLLLHMCKSLPAQAEVCAAQMSSPICQAIAKLIAERADLLAKRLATPPTRRH